MEELVCPICKQTVLVRKGYTGVWCVGKLGDNGTGARHRLVEMSAKEG